jgi:glycosyltransferase involved in cell wall biosynthesis
MSLIHLRQVKPDALYVNTVTLPIWVLAGWILRIPVIVHVREAEELSIALRRVILSQLLLTRCVLANSYATRENVTSSYRSLVDRVRVLYNGMDFPVANSTAPNKPPYRIVLVGRMSPRKGQDVAISALAKLRADGVDARLDLVGDCYPGYEWYVDLLYDLAKQYDVEKDVEFRGFAEDVWPAYAAASLVMVPSRVEPFGNVAVEALAMGNPVVASDVQGLREIIQHGKTGLLIDPEDGEAVAAACKTLILDRELADRMAAAGCEDVRRRFSSERYAADIAGVLTGL